MSFAPRLQIGRPPQSAEASGFLALIKTLGRSSKTGPWLRFRLFLFRLTAKHLVILSFFMTFAGLQLFAQVDRERGSCTLRLEGRVLDIIDDSPLEGALVRFGSDQAVFTDALGRFALLVCPQAGLFSVEHSGCPTYAIRLDLQRDSSIELRMSHRSDALDEVLVLEHLLAPGVEVFDERAWKASADLDFGRRLEQSGSVRLIRTGAAPAKPVYQGFTGNRLLIINEGVRMSGQQWGFDHAPEIDPVFARDIQILSGSRALWYGPEALGGALAVSRGAIRPDAGTELKLLQSLSSNGYGAKSAFQIDFRPQSERSKGAAMGMLSAVGLRMGASVWGSGDAQAPRYNLSNTGRRGSDLHWALDWKDRLNRTRLELFYDRFQEQFGLLAAAQVGSTTDLERALASDKPLYIKDFTYEIQAPNQEVVHELFKASLRGLLSGSTEWFATYSRQVNFRDEFDVESVLEPSDLRYAITTHLPEFGFENHGGSLHWKAKVQGLYQANTYQGRFFMPNFERAGLGLVSGLEFSDANGAFYELGTRWDIDRFDVYLNPDRQVLQRSSIFNAPSFGISRTRRGPRGASKLTLGSVYRPPHVHERYSKGVHHGQFSYEQGDSNLRGERSWELSYDLESPGASGRSKWGFQAYARWVDGYIQIRPDRAILTIRGAYPAFVYDQTQALFLGIDGRYRREFSPRWSAELSCNVLFPRDLIRSDGLFYTPPIHAAADLIWQKERYRFSATAQWTARAFFAPEKLDDFVPPPPGYVLLGFDGEFRPSSHWSLGLRIDNALNASYRDYLDRFRYFADATGFNLSLRAVYHWPASTSP